MHHTIPMEENLMPSTPEPLLRAFEKFYLDITEPLDPYIALALTNLSLRVAETAYLMGYQDGQHSTTSPCQLCGTANCLASGIAR
jgi:hypothetical protein